MSLETRSRNASEEAGFHKRSDRPCDNTSATPPPPLFLSPRPSQDVRTSISDVTAGDFNQM